MEKHAKNIESRDCDEHYSSGTALNLSGFIETTAAVYLADTTKGIESTSRYLRR